MKLTNGLTKYMNAYITQIIQQDLLAYMQQLKQNILISKEDDKVSDYFGYHEEEEDIIEKKDIEDDLIDLVRETLDTGNYAKEILSERTLQDGLFKSKLLSSFREVRFSK